MVESTFFSRGVRAMRGNDVRDLLAKHAPEYFRNAERQKWFPDALKRLEGIAARQHAEYVRFGLSEDVATKLTAGLMRRLSAYIANETQYKRLASSTRG